MESFTAYLFRQPILRRDGTPFGCEIQVCAAIKSSDALERTLSGTYLDINFSEELTQNHLAKNSLIERSVFLVPDTVSRVFIAVGLRDLLNTMQIEYIICASDAFKIQGQMLTVSIEEGALPLGTTEEDRTLIGHIYLLKDSGVEIAFSSFNLLEGGPKIQNTLSICNYIKVDFRKSQLGEKLSAKPESLNRLHDYMNIITHTKKVIFVAGRIEHEGNHVLARSLPFDYFQGDYYSLPKVFTEKRISLT